MQPTQEDEPGCNPYFHYSLQQRLDILNLAESNLKQLPPSDTPTATQLSYEATIELITATLTHPKVL